MKIHRFLFAALAIVAFPVFAADRSFEITGWAAWVDNNSSGTFNATNPNQPFDVSFNGKLGYGVGANIFFSHHISGSFDVVQVKPEASVRGRTVGAVAFNQSGFRMTPITAVLQWHFIPNGTIDPYLGAGAGYVMFDRVEGRGFPNLSSIDFEDDAGLVINGGVGIGLGKSFAIVVDGKYIPLKSSADAVFVSGTTASRVKINPAIFSAGLSWRF